MGKQILSEGSFVVCKRFSVLSSELVGSVISFSLHS